MKKKIKTIALSLFTTVAFAQTGINTFNPQGILHVDGAKDNPAAGAPAANQQINDFIVTPQGQVGIGTTVLSNDVALEVKSSNKGVLLPRIPLTSRTDQMTVPSPTVGLMVYNTGTGGLINEGYLFWNGTEWRKLDNSTTVTPAISSIVCINARLDPPTYTAGTAYTGILTVPYTGGNGGSYNNPAVIPSTGVTGLNAVLNPSNLQIGSGNFIYTVTGTPSASSPSLSTFAIPAFHGTAGCNVTVGDKTFSVGETQSFSVKNVDIATFTATGTAKVKMNGKAVTNTENITNKLLIETAGLTSTSPGVLVIEGLRLDFKAKANNTIDPVFLNTTNAPITYSISALSTVNAYITGVNTVIAANAVSFKVDGDDNFLMANNAESEYINAQLTFPNGAWYQITFYANQIDSKVNGYWTAIRLQ